MKYRIEQKESFRIVGLKMASSWSPEKQEGFENVPKFWQAESQKGTIANVCFQMNAEPKGLLGVTVGNWQQAGEFDYYIAAASTKPLPEGMYEYQVPACTWAIFECKGAMPHAIQNMQKRIMTEWFPNSGYQYENAPDIEQYSEGDQTSEDYICWIWVPIKK